MPQLCQGCGGPSAAGWRSVVRRGRGRSGRARAVGHRWSGGCPRA
ncbi:hypothetical protein PAI11_27950 [Patulibacter medicamentivorans]|uniref:Uncharacterized protein n=1 Tax=Patulibacter medicamentivorans TaxID=1097667 RepID=H0E7J3_9ACTN|nr:hypothetical protein PAI11_27950 [Patulibacter medicamentivorans]